MLKNQLDNKTVEAPADDIKFAKVDTWHIPKTDVGQPCRRAAYVVPPVSDDSLSEQSSSESETEDPKHKLADRTRREREYSDAEDDIPTRAVVGQRSSPAGYILYCNIFIIKPYNIGHTDLDVFVCKSFCHIDIIIQV